MIDEDSRPYHCPWCSKGFNRGCVNNLMGLQLTKYRLMIFWGDSDLLYRHKQTHIRREEGGAQSLRASRACRTCVQSKSKCTDQKPCQRCVSKKIACVPAGKSTHHNDKQVEAAASNAAVIVSPTESTPAVQQPTPNESTSIGMIHSSDTNSQCEALPQSEPLLIQPSHMDAIFSLERSISPLHGNYSFTDAFILPTSDLDPSCFDLDFETLQMLTQPALVDIYNPDQTNINHLNQPSPASSRFEVFKRSPWLWTPIRFDHAYAGQDNLRLNENALDPLLCLQEKSHFQKSFTPASVDSSCRDRILFMIFNTAKSSLSLQSFPSVSFLDRMVQVYFGWNNVQSTSWIHAPSFFPTSCHSELLSIIIAAGSSDISIPEVWKMGYALQERSRLSLSVSVRFFYLPSTSK